jgi:hypothetical protein
MANIFDEGGEARREFDHGTSKLQIDQSNLARTRGEEPPVASAAPSNDPIHAHSDRRDVDGNVLVAWILTVAMAGYAVLFAALWLSDSPLVTILTILGGVVICGMAAEV